MKIRFSRPSIFDRSGFGPQLWIIFLFAIFLSACSPASSTPPPALLNIYAVPAAGPWLIEAYACAGEQGTILNATPDPDTADLSLRIGEPPNLATRAFQVDSEEILVVTHRESPIQNLSLLGARALFSGQGDPSVQVWVFSDDDDIQRIFNDRVMQGAPVTSLALLAISPQQMSDTLNAEKNAVGILPRHWKAGSVREVYSAGEVPVLAITPSQPSGMLADLIACLQK